MKRGLLWICAALLLLLTACGEEAAEPTPTPTPTPVQTPVQTPGPTPAVTPGQEVRTNVNPLTGEPMEEEAARRRPIAVMLNNLKAALPQQGQSQADIIYEVLTEGGITRMMGVYQSVDGVGTIGSIRSARSYFVELALGHDAIYLHAGGSDDAYEKIKEWKAMALDGVRGPYMSNTERGNLMWRDPTRKKTMSAEHTAVTSGDQILKLFPQYSFRQEHEEGYVYEMNFAEDGTPEGGEDALSIKVGYSSYKTGTFEYDPETGLYMVGEYGKAYIDGNTGEQVGVTNVVVLRTACKNTGDALKHITVDLSSGGEGYYACGGKYIEITWSKDYPDGQLRYFDLNGDPVVFGVGHTYVNIIPLDTKVVLE